MKLLVDINHPAHVHFFRNFIEQMKLRGHEVLVTASEKDIAIQLLREYKIDFIHVGNYGKSIWRKVLQIPLMAIKLIRIARKHRPDVMLGIASSRISHASIFSKSKSFVFTDTEHAIEQILLFKPFADKIITPNSFARDLGGKQVKYNGLHDLAYLHPSHFQPKTSSLEKAGMHEDEVFFLVRFVSWEASHDIGKKSLTEDQRIDLIDFLSKHGKVLISSESNLPEQLKKHEFRIEPQLIHDVMSYATICIGEGGTMATEAAVMGTPSILINPLQAGVFKELSEEYDLMIQLNNQDGLISTLQELLQDPKKLKEDWQEKRKKLLKNKLDVTKWMINFVENAQ